MKTIFLFILSFSISISAFAQSGLPGTWNQNTAYSSGSLVISNGSTYLAQQAVPSGTALTSTAYWQSLDSAVPTSSPGSAPTSTPDVSTAPTSTPASDTNTTVTPSGLSTASNEAFVKQQYRDFFGRDADDGGLTYWAGELDAGRKVRANLSMDFVYSTEFQNNVAPVVRLYFAYFNRLPDTSGLSYWISEYTSGNRTLAQISDSFQTSSEFTTTYGSLQNPEFVTLIYQNLFSRTPDQGGYDYWLGELNSGAKTKGTAMVGYSESDEYKNAQNNRVSIVSYYYGMLRRSPDQGGFDYWVGRLDSGDTALDLVSGFLSSTEYQGRDFTQTH